MKNREKMHEELMSKLFKKNHPYASLERSNSENSDPEDFMPVVKIRSGYSSNKQLILLPFCAFQHIEFHRVSLIDAFFQY